MIDRDTLKTVLDSYLSGRVSRDQLSRWAYEVISEQGEPKDHLVTEILYNLVSFHDVADIFDQYRPSREKLEYFVNWLDGHGDCDWDQYTAIFDPGKLM